MCVNAYVACEGPYLVQLADPGINPPNLAAVQEVSAGIYRTAVSVVAETELWVDDIRLTEPVSRMGTAMAVSGRLTASDVADMQFNYVRQDGAFQQIGQDPTYRTTGAMLLSTALVTWLIGMRILRFTLADLRYRVSHRGAGFGLGADQVGRGDDARAREHECDFCHRRARC